MLGEHAPGYGFLTSISPTYRPFWFWHGIGSILITWTASNNQAIQKIFSCRLARYLGRISFSLYLIHSIVIHVLALWLIPLMWQMTGNDTILGFELGFFLASLIHVPVTLVVADIFSRVFDDTSIRFAKWLESRLISDESTTTYQRLPVKEVV